MTGLKIIPVFLSQEGCPGQCVYCLREVVGAGQSVMRRTPKEEVEAACALFFAQGIQRADEIAFYGGTFTSLPANRQEAFLDAAVKQRQRGFIQRIRLSTRPDAIDQETCERLAFYGVDLVELGVQSFDETVLLASGRNYEPQCVERSMKLLQQAGIDVAFQLMLGLPGQTWQSVLQTATETLRLHPVGVRIYPLLVFEGTELYGQWRDGVYKPLPLATAVAQASYWRRLFLNDGIPVFRIGLQLGEAELQKVAAGPWHPSFSALAAAHNCRAVLDCHLRNLSVDGCRHELIMHQTSLAIALQQDKKRLAHLVDNYSAINIKITKNITVNDNIDLAVN